MPASANRYDLLRTRLSLFTRMLPGAVSGDVRAVHRTRVASRRLRELLPVLQLENPAGRKLSRRLRNVTRRLGSVREADVLLILIGELRESGRHREQALRMIAAAVRNDRDQTCEKLPGKTTVAEFRRLARKLEAVADELESADDSRIRGRAWRWALDARVASRARTLGNAVNEAGSVYLPERLHGVRLAVKKLRYSVELVAEAMGLKQTPDSCTLQRAQQLLGRLHDLQVLVDCIRHVQASLAAPAARAGHDLRRAGHVTRAELSAPARTIHPRTREHPRHLRATQRARAFAVHRDTSSRINHRDNGW